MSLLDVLRKLSRARVATTAAPEQPDPPPRARHPRAEASLCIERPIETHERPARTIAVEGPDA